VSDYSIMRATDAPDFTGGDPSPFLGYARPMGSEQVALNIRVLAPGASHVPPGEDPAGGHSHNTIEEIYFVIDGEIKVKVGEDVHTLGPRDAILIGRGTPRAVRNESGAEAAFAMVSMKMEDPVGDSHRHEGFWPTG
jgi:mannose-6-phosphate isomerase-like protein (cupin superfamily)